MSSSNRKFGRTFVFVVFFMFGLFALMLTWPIEGHVHRRNPVLMRQSNMRSLAIAMGNYSEEFEGRLFQADQWHEVMDPWLGIDSDDPVYYWNDSPAFYILPIPWENLQMPTGISKVQLKATSFMFEDPAIQKDYTFVSFWDGSTRSLTDDEFAELVNTDLAILLGVSNP